MNPALLFLLASSLPGSALPAVPLAAGDGEEESAGEGEENVVHLYDVSSLAVNRQGIQDRYFHLAPFAAPRSYDTLAINGSIDQMVGVDEIVSLLVELLDGEFEYEGRKIYAVEFGRILVRGPEGLHKRVVDVLAFLDELLNAQAELTVNVIELEAGVEAPFPGRAIVSREDAERWLDSVAQAPTQQEFRLALRADRPAEINLTQTSPVLLDYDVEIAQASTIGDPIVSQIAVGTRAFVYAMPAPQGVALSFVLKRGDLIGEIREQDLRLNGHVRTDQGLIESPSGRVFQTFDLLGRGFAFDAVLAPDQALVIHDQIDLGRDRRNEVVVLRLTSGELPYRKTFRYGTKGQDLIAVDLDYLSPLSVQAGGYLVDDSGLPFKLMEWISGGGQEGILGVRLAQHGGYGSELLEESSELLSFQDAGTYRLIRYFDYSGEGAGASTAELAKVQVALDSMKDDASMIEVGVKLSRLGKWAGTPVSATFPMRLEHSAAVALGIENPVVFDYDVEVAQEASVADAQVFSEFEGLVLWLHATRSPRGDLVIDVSAGGSQMAGQRRKIDVGMHDLEQSTFDQVLARQRVTFRKDQTEPWKVVIGDATSGKGVTGSLRLEIEVAR